MDAAHSLKGQRHLELCTNLKESFFFLFSLKDSTPVTWINKQMYTLKAEDTYAFPGGPCEISLI